VLKIKSFFSVVLVFLFLVVPSSVVFSQQVIDTNGNLPTFNEQQKNINNLLNQLENLSTDLEEASEQLSIILPQLKDLLTKAQLSLTESELLVEDLRKQLKDLENLFNTYQTGAEAKIVQQTILIDGLKFKNKVLGWTSIGSSSIALVGWGLYLFDKIKAPTGITEDEVADYGGIGGNISTINIPLIGFHLRL